MSDRVFNIKQAALIGICDFKPLDFEETSPDNSTNGLLVQLRATLRGLTREALLSNVNEYEAAGERTGIDLGLGEISYYDELVSNVQEWYGEGLDAASGSKIARDISALADILEQLERMILQLDF